jgi:hypothetical protein
MILDAEAALARAKGLTPAKRSVENTKASVVFSDEDLAYMATLESAKLRHDTVSRPKVQHRLPTRAKLRESRLYGPDQDVYGDAAEKKEAPSGDADEMKGAAAAAVGAEDGDESAPSVKTRKRHAPLFKRGSKEEPSLETWLAGFGLKVCLAAHAFSCASFPAFSLPLYTPLLSHMTEMRGQA